MTQSLPFNYFSLTGSGSVSQFLTGISTANWGGDFNHNNNTTKAVLKDGACIPLSSVNYLTDYLHHLEDIGVNHVALNLRFNSMDMERTLEYLAEKALPHFHSNLVKQKVA